jgi:ribosomal protein S18 acetylase RimI-like enzyme
MTIIDRNVDVAMRRANLDNLPTFALPPGFSATYYQPGDAAAWLAVQQAAERHILIDEPRFWRAFGWHPEELPRRQIFIRNDAGTPIGTITAWFGNDKDDDEIGRIHWVAIVPDYQGRGLAKPMLALACWRLRELGHTHAFLDTSSARVPAINLYRSFGFAPDLATPEDAANWQELLPFLK